MATAGTSATYQVQVVDTSAAGSPTAGSAATLQVKVVDPTSTPGTPAAGVSSTFTVRVSSPAVAGTPASLAVSVIAPSFMVVNGVLRAVTEYVVKA